MATRKFTYKELETKLLETEYLIDALRNHEVDVIVGPDQIAMVRLREAEEALDGVKAELERRVLERTTELAQVNQRLRETIQEQKRIRGELERSASQLRNHAELLDLAHDMIFVHDMEGKIIFWNRGAEVTYGWKKQEALGQRSHELLQTEFSEPLMRIMARIIADGWWEGELVQTTREGRRVVVATRWVLRTDAEGQPAAILAIDNDITARKRAEQEMAQARGFAESIIDTIRESLVVLDPQLAIVSANRSFHETFGTTPSQVEGRPLHALEGELWAHAELHDRLGRVLTPGESFEGFEIECLCGVPRAFVLSARPMIHQPDGRSEWILLVIQDITVSKWQEREIRADKEQLDLLTEELLMIEERQRRQIALALHDTVGQSLAFSKRELNLLRRQVSDEMGSRLAEVCQQLDQAIEQTRELTFELSPSTLYSLGLQPAIEELAEQFAEAEGFRCQVRSDGQCDVPNEPVRSMLYRAVRELLVNVAKHAEARNVEILLHSDEQGLRIAVQDDGRGFDSSVVRGQGRRGGFGILSVRERLTRMGGALAVESQQGQGTKVTMMIPLAIGQRSDGGI